MADPEGAAGDGARYRRLAAAHEAGLPDDQRRARGQFYTPPTLARALVRWATPHRGDLPRVLDPAAGGGVFALAAYDRLRGRFGAGHDDAAGSLSLVDVDGGALSLAADALAARGGADTLASGGADAVRTRRGSFFDAAPGDLGGPFDAVVGNPPFVRHEDLSPDKDHYRRHLAALGPPGETPYADGDRALSARSDAYVYFVTHATRFLRPGGRLAVVTPTKWLSTRYGESFRAFLADHYRVHAVVGFDARAFEDALVDAALLFAERGGDRAERGDPAERGGPVGDGPVRFVRLRAAPSADAVLHAVAGEDGDGTAAREGREADAVRSAATDGTAGTAGSAPTARTATVPRRAFRERAKLAHYLDAPAPVLSLLDHDGLVPLSALAAVTYGYKTGANDFFFLAPDDRERWPVADRFLSPAVASLRDVEGRVLRAADAPVAVLDVHDYVASVLDDGTGGRGSGERGDDDRGTGSRGSGGRGTGDRRTDDPAATAKAAMERDGHDALREYVEWGERQGFHERRTCAGRRVWFDLGDLVPPAVLHPKFFDERVLVVRNRGGLVPSNAIDCLRLREEVDPTVLLGALNSTVHRLLLECWGRAEGGGALQLMTYELAAVPVLDVRRLDAGEAAAVADGWAALVEGDAGARRRLDAAVLDALDADASGDRLRACRREMVARRTDDGVAVPGE